MAGLRVDGVMQKRFIGDREHAALYLPEARKVLGYVVQEAARNQLLTYKYTHTTVDGVVITGELVGGQRRVTINVLRAQKIEQVLLKFDNFVVFPRDTDHANGINTDHPQLVLKPQWKTLFFDTSIAGYNDFSLPKGIYRFVRGVDAFPDGLRHAGNIDWIGPNKERVSWYGPSSRYFFDPYVQPQTQYGKFVFYLGQILLDVDQYITDSDSGAFTERYVLGAAMHGLRLIVVMAELGPVGTSTDQVDPHTTVLDAPWPLGTLNVTFCRFSLVRQVGINDAMNLKVAPKSRKVLWSGSLARPLCPCFFNADGKTGVLMGLPEKPSYTIDIYSDFVDPPSTSNEVHVFKFSPGQNSDDDAGTHVVNPLSCEPGGFSILATDWDGNNEAILQVVRTPIGDSTMTWALLFNGTYYNLYFEEIVVDSDPEATIVTIRNLLHADLRENVFIFAFVNFSTHPFDDTGDANAHIEVWRGGSLVNTISLDPAAVQICGLPRFAGYFDAQSFDNFTKKLADQWISPMIAFYGTGIYTDVFGNDFISFDGTSAGYCYLPYPYTEYFGNETSNNTAIAVDPVPLHAFANGDFDGNKADNHGHYSVLGCASTKDTTLLSCYGFSSGSGESKFGIFGSNDGSTLEKLTNISGTHKRYHPIWLVGALPKQPTTLP